MLEFTLNRLNEVMNYTTDYEFEVVLVDDGSTDGTRQLIEQRCEKDRRIKCVTLTRNFGHQVAVSAGLDFASGSAAVIIDADLQDPPEVIPEMISAWERGFDVAYGQRISRLGEGKFKLWSAWLFYRLINNLVDFSIPRDTGDFRLLSRRAIDSINSFPEKSKFLRGLISWTGFRATPVKYTRDPRFAGTTKYPLRKMIRLATSAIFSFSTKPLDIVVASGVGISLLSFFLSIWFGVSKFILGNVVPGWTALIVAITFLGGVQILAIGIVGKYVGGIFHEVKGRPLYIVDSNIGFD